MKKFTITYTNDANSTNLTLTTSDANLVVDVVTQLECHADDTETTTTTTPTTPTTPSVVNATTRPEVQVETVLVAQATEEIDPNLDQYPISLRRWSIHNYQRIADIGADALYELQVELLRDGIIKRTCTRATTDTYYSNSVTRLREA